MKESYRLVGRIQKEQLHLCIQNHWINKWVEKRIGLMGFDFHGLTEVEGLAEEHTRKVVMWKSSAGNIPTNLTLFDLLDDFCVENGWWFDHLYHKAIPGVEGIMLTMDVRLMSRAEKESRGVAV